ncbi:MAG: response regulator [Desulfobacula sp.]|nr:response regulator [Desulfobacula sp.]
MSERVLLIDDERDFLEVMSERLGARGMNVSTAESAQSALDTIGKESFDAVILDFSMPEMDGIQALKLLLEKKPELQVILLTGYGTVEKSVEAIKMGASDFIEKPADIEKLVDKIKQAKSQRMLILEKQQDEKIQDILERYGV